MAAISTLVDTFTTKDTSKWTWDTNASVVSGQLSMTATQDKVYRGVQSTAQYDLTGSALLVQVPQVATGNTVDTELALAVQSGSTFTDAAVVIVEGGTIYFRMRVGGANSDTTATYSATTHRWWKIAHSGSNILFSTSPDGTTWTQRRSVANTLPSITALYVRLDTGFWDTEPSPGAALWDNVNNPPSSSTPASAAGSITLAGSATTTARPTAAGTLTLSGTATAGGAVTAGGALSLGGSATARATITAAGALTIGGTATAQVTGTAAGPLTLAGSGAAAGRATATGTVTLTGTGTTGAPTASATGTVTLAGTATARAVVITAGSIGLDGAAAASALAAAAATLTLTGLVVTAAGTVNDWPGVATITGRSGVSTLTGQPGVAVLAPQPTAVATLTGPPVGVAVIDPV